MSQTANLSRYRWYVLAVLTLAQTCHGIDRAVIGLVLKPLGAEFHLSGAQLGLVAGLAYGLPFALAAIPFGYAVDRLTRKTLLTGALLAWSGATALCALAGGYGSLLGGRAAVGVAEAGGSPTGLSILSDYFGPDRRSSAIGTWYLSSGIGFAVAFFCGGLILAHYGWRMTFVVAGVPGLLVTPLIWLTVREPRRGAQDQVLHDSVPGSLLARLHLLLARPGVAWGVIAVTCIATGIYGMSTWLVTFLIDSHGVTLPRAGMIVAIAYGLLGSVGGLAAGWGADKVHARHGGFDAARTARIGAAIPLATAISGLLAVSLSSAGGAIAAIMAAGLFSASYNGPVNAMIVTQAGPQLRGLAVACTQTCANLIGVGLGAWLIGKVSDEVGGRNGVAWGIGAAMMFCLLGAVFLILAARQIRAREPTPTLPQRT